MASEQEMMGDLAAADAAGDHQLAQHIAGKIKESRGAPDEPGWGVVGKAAKWATTPFLPHLAAERRTEANSGGGAFPLTATSGNLRTALQAFLGGVPGYQGDMDSDEAMERLSKFREEFPVLARALPFAGGLAQPAMLPGAGGAAPAAVPAAEAASAPAAAAAATTEAEREALRQSWRAIREGRAPIPGAAAAAPAPSAPPVAPPTAPPATPPRVQSGPQLAGESFGFGPSRPQRGASGAQLAYRSQRFGVPEQKPSIGPMDLSAETQAKLLKALEPEVAAAAPAIAPAVEAPAAAAAEPGVAGAVGDYAKKHAAKEIGTGVGAMLGHPFLGRMVGAGVGKFMENPAAFKSLSDKMATFAKVAPQVMGKFGPPLLQASARGADALAVTHYQLAQTPEYQRLMHLASSEDPK